MPILKLDKEEDEMSVKENAVLSVLGIETEVEGLTMGEVYKNIRKVKELGEILAKHEKVLKAKAFDMAEAQGEQDDKGSYMVRLPDGSWFKKEARTSVKVKKDEAVRLFAEKGLNDRLTPEISELDARAVYEYLRHNNPALVQGITFTIEDSELEQAFYSGEITDAELQDLIERNVTYALKTSKK